jgi:hypothetical protein
MEKDTWKDFFKRQVGTGKFWKKLLGDEFERRSFLDRSDAVFIYEKAQADAYENVMSKLKDKINETEMNEIQSLIGELWENTDDSALGMNMNWKD